MSLATVCLIPRNFALITPVHAVPVPVHTIHSIVVTLTASLTTGKTHKIHSSMAAF